jgi:hypothetical protein
MASCRASRVRAPARLTAALSAGFGFLDGSKIGRIAGQEEYLTPFRLASEPDSGSFVRMQVVHHHNLSGLQGGSQHLFDVDLTG